MADGTKNINVGNPLDAAGAIFGAVSGTEVPTSAKATLGSEFKKMGYVSEEGVKNAFASTTQEIPAWGGDIVYTAQTSYKETFAMKFIETNINVLKEFYGDANVELKNGELHIGHKNVELPAHPWVIDMAWRDEEAEDKVKRIVIPNAKVGERGEMVYDGKTPVGYAITLSALPDATGFTAHEYIAAVE